MRIWPPDALRYSARNRRLSTWISCVESTSATPMLVPLERVRIAGAPSNVIRLSCERAPLMLKPPLSKPKFRPESGEPVRRPAAVSPDRSDCVRSVQAHRSGCRVINFWTLAESVWRVCALAVTSTVSVAWPTCRMISARAVALGSSLLCDDLILLKSRGFGRDRIITRRDVGDGPESVLVGGGPALNTVASSLTSDRDVGHYCSGWIVDEASDRTEVRLGEKLRCE